VANLRNIIDVLQKLTQDAEPKDLVYNTTQESGHRARAKTIFDESLVPTSDKHSL
jgi:hypothetical protein